MQTFAITGTCPVPYFSPTSKLTPLFTPYVVAVPSHRVKIMVKIPFVQLDLLEEILGAFKSIGVFKLRIAETIKSIKALILSLIINEQEMQKKSLKIKLLSLEKVVLLMIYD